MDEVSDTCALESRVGYAEVDRVHGLALPALVQRLQEAAIQHADQAGLGTRAMSERGESWVLHRLAVVVHRYPAHGDMVKVETWSRGVRTFRGWREFRVSVGGEVVAEGASLWFYLTLATRALTRVPEEVARGFPVREATTAATALIERTLAEPGAGAAPWPRAEVSLRFSDVDGNGHVNNAAYFDCVQTALARAGLVVRPREVNLRFLREIPPAAREVEVRWCEAEGGVRFALNAGGGEGPSAVGEWR